MSAPPLLTVEGLCMRFGGLLAVDSLDFTAEAGRITALIGPNGAGKTTVFNCVTGFYRSGGGRLALARPIDGAPDGCADVGVADQDGADEGGESSFAAQLRALTLSTRRSRRVGGYEIFLLERMADFEIASRAGVARTFQNIRLFRGMTVLENLIVAQHNRLVGGRFSLAGRFGFGAYRARERAALDEARFWLDRVGLAGRADEPAGALPYGDQRRLEIARAMAASPILLCLDEPAAGLNPRESHELAALLAGLRDERRLSILLIEHDMSVVMAASDHVVVLDHGVKIAEGSPAEIRHDEAVVKAYLGVAEEPGVAVAGA